MNLKFRLIFQIPLIGANNVLKAASGLFTEKDCFFTSEEVKIRLRSLTVRR